MKNDILLNSMMTDGCFIVREKIRKKSQQSSERKIRYLYYACWKHLVNLPRID